MHVAYRNTRALNDFLARAAAGQLHMASTHHGSGWSELGGSEVAVARDSGFQQTGGVPSGADKFVTALTLLQQVSALTTALHPSDFYTSDRDRGLDPDLLLAEDGRRPPLAVIEEPDDQTPARFFWPLYIRALLSSCAVPTQDARGFFDRAATKLLRRAVAPMALRTARLLAHQTGALAKIAREHLTLVAGEAVRGTMLTIDLLKDGASKGDSDRHPAFSDPARATDATIAAIAEDERQVHHALWHHLRQFAGPVDLLDSQSRNERARLLTDISAKFGTEVAAVIASASRSAGRAAAQDPALSTALPATTEDAALEELIHTLVTLHTH